jgi:hypothetical protein
MRISEFLEKFDSILLPHGKMQILNRKEGPNKNYGGTVLLDHEDFQIFVSEDNSHVFVEFLSKFDSRKSAWYPIDLVARCLGITATVSYIDKENSDLLNFKFDDICDLFKKENVDQTLQQMRLWLAAKTKLN